MACRAISNVPGIGRPTTTALVATIEDAKTFRSGREFAALLGLIPQQSGMARFEWAPSRSEATRTCAHC